MIPADYPFLAEWDHQRYSPAYLRMGPNEDVVVANVIEVLRHLGVIAFAVDVGAKELRGRAAGALVRAGRRDLLSRLKGTTGAGFKGLADVLGCTATGQFVAIECKRPAKYAVSKTGRLIIDHEAGSATEEQLGFLHAIYRSGGIAGVAWHGLDARQAFDSQAWRRGRAA